MFVISSQKASLRALSSSLTLVTLLHTPVTLSVVRASNFKSNLLTWFSLSFTGDGGGGGGGGRSSSLCSTVFVFFELSLSSKNP